MAGHVKCSYYTLLAALVGMQLALPVWAAAPDHDEASAEEHHLGIVAVVGKDAVSSYDVENRIKFIIATARLSNSPDIIARIRPQVIRSLIDEKLQTQEAAKNDITATPEEVTKAIGVIEAQRNMPPGTIFHILEENHVPKEVFMQQIRAQLLWNKLVTKKIRPLVHISEDEITLAKRRYVAPQSKQDMVPQEYKIAVITLPVDKPSRENDIHTLSEKLVREVRSGASFEEVSRQFSSVTASAGGKVETFWVRPEQLDPHVASSLEMAKSGTVTDPMRSNEGYTIIKVYDTRPIGGKKAKPAVEEKPKDIEVTMKEILLRLKPDAGSKEANVMLQIGQEVAKHPGTCSEKGIAGAGDLNDFDIEVNFNTRLMSALPPGLKVIAENQKIGDISSPVATYEGIRLYMLCDKKETEGKPVDREEIYHMVLEQKMDLEVQKYMRNLRRETFIDIR